MELLWTTYTIFITRSNFISFAMQNHRKLFFSDCVIKPEAVEGGGIKIIWTFLHSSELMQFGHKGNFDYRDITQKLVNAETWDTA